MSGPPIILIGGSLDAARGPGRRGIPVYCSMRGRFSTLRASKYLAALPSAPRLWSAEFPDWLESAMDALHGAVVVPTADEAVWWLSRYAGRSSQDRSRFAVSPFESVQKAMVKGRLAKECARAGLAAPASMVLTGEADLTVAATTVGFPMVLKPQTRVGMRHWARGRIIRNAQELATAFEWFRSTVKFTSAVADDAPDVVHPLAQAYIRRPGREVYHLTGYRAASGSYAARAHRKLLQAPLRFGNGVLFESTPVDEPLAARLVALLDQIGYHGIFEAEFLEHAGERLLIDLNVRTFNGLGLTIAQGLNLVLLAWMEASGQCEALEAELAAVRAAPFRQVAWVDHAVFATLLAGQLLSGGLSFAEAGRYLRWIWRHRSHTVAHFYARDDWAPGVVHLGWHLYGAVRRPRAFVGQYFKRGLDR